MKYLLLLLFIIPAISFCRPDDVYLTNGYVYKNVFVVDTSSMYLRIKMPLSTGTQVIPIDLSLVRFIDAKPYDSTSTSSTTAYNPADLEKAHPDLKKMVYANPTSFGSTSYGTPGGTRVKPANVILGIVCFGLAWDFFSNASQVPSGLNDSYKSRQTVLGIISVIGGIASLATCTEEVKLEMSANSVTVTYNF
jgi:hypothetical protein